MEINKIYAGKNEQILPIFPDNFFDSCVTDPPYGWKFMGKKWDYKIPSVEFWHEVYRVMKPGAYLLCACGTRTQHRMASNIEDGGFEIRDVITWHYGQGYAKSLNLGEGRGTALKPATEFFTMARKPIASKTVAVNVQSYGTGGINIVECRIERQEGDRTEYGRSTMLDYPKDSVAMGRFNKNAPYTPDELGRFPANVIFDDFTGQLLDDQAPASRFFYCPKSDNFERDKGLEKLKFSRIAEHHVGDVCATCGGRIFQNPNRPSACTCEIPVRSARVLTGNHHPTVKPIDLMRYLVRLVTPKNGIVLDPYAGSCSTAIGAKMELRNFVCIEEDPEYCLIGEARVAAWNPEKYLPQQLF